MDLESLLYVYLALALLLVVAFVAGGFGLWRIGTMMEKQRKVFIEVANTWINEMNRRP